MAKHIRSKKSVNSSWIEGKSILITGATGSFGNKCIEILLKEYKPNKVVVFSRDELKQHEMQQSGLVDSRLRYFIGDIRDKDRLMRAMNGIELVIHAAALKQVPACEYNPMEAIMTNILGTKNVIDAAIDCGVKKVLALSTDKAVNPVNLYGATKLCAEKLVIQSNSYSSSVGTKFSCVRYGNVVGSRGSVIPVFLKQRSSGRVRVTDERMTRFWITLDQGIHFVLGCIEEMHGGEVFIPKIPSMRVMDLVRAVAPNCLVDIVGIRPGEKLHEVLLGDDESRNAVEMENMYVILPTHPWWDSEHYKNVKRIEGEFEYSSNENTEWLTQEQIKELAKLDSEEAMIAA